MTREEQRLEESRERDPHWKRWGPYPSERPWGTVHARTAGVKMALPEFAIATN